MEHNGKPLAWANTVPDPFGLSRGTRTLPFDSEAIDKTIPEPPPAVNPSNSRHRRKHDRKRRSR
jgi:hypothetical protein